MATNKIVNKDYLERQFYRYNNTIVAPQFQTLNTSAGNKVDKVDGYAFQTNIKQNFYLLKTTQMTEIQETLLKN